MTSLDPLSNPIWQALISSQARLAQGAGMALRTDPEHAPFIAIGEASAAAAAAVAELLEPGEKLSLVGVVPPEHSKLVLKSARLLQMRATGPVAPPASPTEILRLGEADVADMLELTSRVFPGYFRRRSIEMGNFIGIRIQGRLAAMAGERLQLPGYREISGVCTDTGFLGRGYARLLVSTLMREQYARGETPILHVNPANQGAIRIYLGLGFEQSHDLDLAVVSLRAD